MIKQLIKKIFGVVKANDETKKVSQNESAKKPRKSSVDNAHKNTSKLKISRPKLNKLNAKQHGINPALVSPNAVRVTSTLQEAGFDAFIVGGAVRDLLLGVKPKDFDIATNATPEQVKRLFRRAFIIGRRFQIVHVMFGQELIEVTTFRGASHDEAPKDEFGRVLRDNTFGEQPEDATRRDFTINAMYYDPTHQTVLDYHGGMNDIRKKILRIIGEPTARYREDPVRMLRVVRFAAKLQFEIDPATAAPIPELAALIDNVPTARVFDETLKLLGSGHALACLNQLRQVGLQHGLLPILDHVLAKPQSAKFVTLALNNTDERVRAGKSISPGFLFATLLWHQVLQKWQAYEAAGEHAIPALHFAADDAFHQHSNALDLQRRIETDMRDIWSMQPRFMRRVGKTPYKLIEHPRFRAGLDFLVLRAQAGEIEEELATWWVDFFASDNATRTHLIADLSLVKTAKKPTKKTTKPRVPKTNKNTAVLNEEGAKQVAMHTESTSLSDAETSITTSEAPKKRRRRKKTVTQELTSSAED